VAVSIKKLVLWTAEIGNQPGTLGEKLEPFAKAGADLKIVMAYEKPGDRVTSIVEVGPVTGVKALRAAREAGMTKSSIPCLLIEGDNRAGLGHAVASALGAAGINIQFLAAAATGRKSAAAFGFAAGTDLGAATRVIRSAMKPVRKRR
jgi:hypothetical protein